MASFGSAAWSSVGKKVITGLTGFLLMGFVIVHLIGNLTLLFPTSGPFNHYAHFLETMLHGWLIYVFEVGLLLMFAFHIIAAVTVALTDKMAARKVGYKYARNAGGKSRKTLSSRSMIITGIILGVFVISHIWLFKFAGGNHHETVTVDGVVMKNLYKTVVGTFKGLPFTVFTVVSMVLLGLHLRHGAWSAFQSLGWANNRYLPLLTRIAAVFAVVMAVGFIAIPVILYFNGDPNAMSGGH